ncbi:MAG TPA: hypothetical protein VIJ07_09060 [Dermatophilaceae bacterium]
MSERDAEPVITMITMDRETSSAVFARSDGKEARFPLETSPFDDTSALSRLQYTPAFDTLLAVTGTGDDILFELPKQDGTDQLGGRVVVYLDQNKWSDIAKAMHDPTRVNEEDRLAARQLAEWAHHRRIILPASSGHYYETTKQFDAEERYGLGLTILQLSRGWQMRDPLQVRRDELYTWFRHGSATVAQTRDATVFTLDPNVMHGRVRDRGPYVAPADFSPDAAFQHEALTSAMALIDLMLDSERIKPGPETGWAGANQRFSDWLDDEDRDSQQKRKCIDAFLLWDLRTEIAEESHAAGATPEQLQRWLPIQSAGDIRELHATGLFGEMLHDRHLNKGTKWRPNDLTDMVYLSCAAGYADFVVCENHMGSVLAQGLKRLGRPQRVFRRIRDAVPAIAAALAGTAH